MPRADSKGIFGVFIVIVALLALAGGVICFQGPAFAQQDGEPPAPVFKMQAGAEYRYFETNGVPRTALSGAPAKAWNYLFRAPVKPQRSASATRAGADMFFGVALDGVPIESTGGTSAGRGAPPPGGLRHRDGIYTYAGIPQALLSEDLSHVGYAADGFPVFVSRSKKFKSSYDRSGHYKSGSGNLDLCNGVLINGKFYIYIMTEEFPRVPLCWSGAPDPSFLRRAAPDVVGDEAANEESASSSGGWRGRRAPRN